MVTRTAGGFAGLGAISLLLSLGASGCVKRLAETGRPCPCAQGWACQKAEGEPGVCVDPTDQDAGVSVVDGPQVDVLLPQDGYPGADTGCSGPCPDLSAHYPSCSTVLPEHTGGSWEDVTESIAQQAAHSSPDVLSTLRTYSGPRAIWGSSSKDIYLLAPAGGILHFDGSVWSVDHIQAGLIAMWGSGPNDVFTVGQVMGSVYDKSSLILHYDGVSWTKMVSNTFGPLNGVWGSGPNDVFAVGAAVGTSEPALILHFDGKNWTPMASGIVGGQLSAVWGSGPRDVYAVGSTSVGETWKSLILHYDGSTWQKVASDESTGLSGVWGSGPEDVYAVGFMGVLDGKHIVLHFDGTSWKTLLTTVGSSCYSAVAVWGSGPHDVWAVGNPMWHFDGSRWDQVSFLGFSMWSTAWGSGPGDVWVMGAGNGGLYEVGGGVWHYRAQQQ